jgi:glucuronoarabinoxylan endo-1,4-beta-xylanase
VPARAGTAYIDLSNPRMTLRGVGAATVWLGALTDAEMDKAFTANSGCIGLTVDRIRISPSGDNASELSNAQKAKARGGIVMATPWTPPASMKDNNNTVGGSLLSSQYGAYATYLNNFVNYMSTNGASLYAISVQNEPDITVTYESCDWTPTQLLTFAKNNAGAIGSKVIMSESFHFDHAYTDPILNDTTARANVDIIGGHIYGGGLAAYSAASSAGKEVWMTEHLNTDTSITGVIQTAQEMLDCFAVGNFIVYNWWYVKRSYGPLDDSGNRTKRGCVMAQFARWARPGSTRVACTHAPSTNVTACAFKSGTKVIVIAVNAGTSSVSQTFTISNGTIPTSMNRYRTSATQDLATLSLTSVASGSFTDTLPAQSITTYVSP